MNIYFNTSLYASFPGFPYRFNSAKGDLNYKLAFEDLYDVNTV